MKLPTEFDNNQLLLLLDSLKLNQQFIQEKILKLEKILLDINNPNTNIKTHKIEDLTNFNFDAFFDLYPFKKSSEFTDFLIWFVGYFEGNNNFFINRTNPLSIKSRISIFCRDYLVLEYIKKKLNLEENIRPNTNKNLNYKSFVLELNNKENINKIILILNGNCQLKKTQKMLETWFDLFNVDGLLTKKTVLLSQQNKISLTNAWLTGFIDADGCFASNFCKQKNIKSGWSLGLICQLAKQDEFLVLEYIRSLLNSQTKIIKSTQGNNIFILRLRKIAILARLCEYLETYKLRTTDKKLSFDKWKKLFPYTQQKILYHIIQNQDNFEKFKKQIKDLNSHSIKSPQYRSM